jgi:hypothetical protein
MKWPGFTAKQTEAAFVAAIADALPAFDCSTRVEYLVVLKMNMIRRLTGSCDLTDRELALHIRRTTRGHAHHSTVGRARRRAIAMGFVSRGVT